MTEDVHSADSSDKSGAMNEVVEIVKTVVCALMIALFLRVIFFQPFTIPSASMENTLLTGDRVLVNKLVYHVRDIGRGDIVVFSGQGSWGSTTGAPDPAPPGNPFLRFVDDVLADAGEDLRLGGVERECTVMFTDIRGFTPFSEQLSPERVIEVVNAYLGEMSEAARERFATLPDADIDAIHAYLTARAGKSATSGGKERLVDRKDYTRIR